MCYERKGKIPKSRFLHTVATLKIHFAAICDTLFMESLSTLTTTLDPLLSMLLVVIETITHSTTVVRIVQISESELFRSVEPHALVLRTLERRLQTDFRR
jgi:hypothetical protein